MKKYFYTYKKKDYESDDPIEVADFIFETAKEDEELKNKVLKAIIENLVNEFDDEDYLAKSYGFEETLNLLKEMNIRDAENEKVWMNDVL